MISWTRIGQVSATAAVLATLAACGSGAAPATPAAPAEAGAAHPEGHGQHGSASGALELWAVQTGPLGVVVTDGGGQLLYRYDRDGNAPSAANCTGDCTAAWQPVLAVPDQAPELLGVAESVVGVVARSDGGEQVTLAGWPLYRRVGEPAGLGDAGANGTDGVWFAVTPEGDKATPPG